MLDKLNQLTQSHGTLQPGRGLVTGVIALSLAILCFLGVLAFHFPEYLTTPQLRKDQPVFRSEWQTDFHHFIVNHMPVGFVLLAVNLLVHKLFGWAAKDGVQAWVQALPFPVALFAIILVVGFQAMFNHANVSVRLGPLRYVIVTPDFHHWHHSQDDEAIDKNYAAHFAFIDHLFGTAVQSDRAWPAKYGVVGDYVPDGFWRQFLFPFVWRSKG